MFKFDALLILAIFCCTILLVLTMIWPQNKRNTKAAQLKLQSHKFNVPILIASIITMFVAMGNLVYNVRPVHERNVLIEEKYNLYQENMEIKKEIEKLKLDTAQLQSVFEAEKTSMRNHFNKEKARFEKLFLKEKTRLIKASLYGNTTLVREIVVLNTEKTKIQDEIARLNDQLSEARINLRKTDLNILNYYLPVLQILIEDTFRKQYRCRDDLINIPREKLLIELETPFEAIKQCIYREDLMVFRSNKKVLTLLEEKILFPAHEIQALNDKHIGENELRRIYVDKKLGKKNERICHLLTESYISGIGSIREFFDSIKIDDSDEGGN